MQAIRESNIAERLHWDLNTIDSCPEWWLRVVETKWYVQHEIAEAQRSA